MTFVTTLYKIPEVHCLGEHKILPSQHNRIAITDILSKPWTSCQFDTSLFPNSAWKFEKGNITEVRKATGWRNASARGHQSNTRLLHSAPYLHLWMTLLNLSCSENKYIHNNFSLRVEFIVNFRLTLFRHKFVCRLSLGSKQKLAERM